MSQQPLVSVIIPSYNRAAMIGETLESVLTQTYQNWECIVVDDGSSDNTRKVIEDYVKIDTRIQLFKRVRIPKGPPTCRNIGLEKSNGEYIIFLDSDDLLDSCCLENRNRFMLNKPALDCGVARGLVFKNESYDSDLLISSFKYGDAITAFLNFDIPWITLNQFTEGSL